MGGRGAMLKLGGFSKYRYKLVRMVCGVKVLEPRDERERHTLPERSGTPSTSYMCYYKKKYEGDEDLFKCFIIFDKDRMPMYRIDYGCHHGSIKTLHVHYYKDGNVIIGKVEYLHPGDELYEKHKKLFKGVKI